MPIRNLEIEKTKPAIVILSTLKTDITKCGVCCSISYCSGKEIGHEKKTTYLALTKIINTLCGIEISDLKRKM